MFYAYLLQSEKDSSMYIGHTKDLKKRIVEHNRGVNLSTKASRPWRVIYYEACLNEKDAKRRESYLKTTQGSRMLRLRLKEYLTERRSKDLQTEISLLG